METRGIRNYNPCNIRHSKSTWVGMRKEQTDSAFVQFESMVYGLRAVWVLLHKYRAVHGCNTISKVIARWAPPSENATDSYVRYVSEAVGVGKNQELNHVQLDRLTWLRIIKAMCWIESMYQPSYTTLVQAYNAAFGTKYNNVTFGL